MKKAGKQVNKQGGGALMVLFFLWAPLRGQQVDDQLAYSYLAEPAYAYDMALGELFFAEQQSGSATLLYQMTQDFWQSLMGKAELPTTLFSLSEPLFRLQFEDYLGEGVAPTGLTTIRSARPVVQQKTARVESKLIFDDQTYLLTTLYFIFTKPQAEEEKEATSSQWLIEAADFYPNDRQSLQSGSNYEPRSDHFLQGVSR